MEDKEIISKIIKSSKQELLLNLIYELVEINGTNAIILDRPLIEVESIYVDDFDDENDDYLVEDNIYFTYADYITILNYRVGSNNHYLLSGGYNSIDENKYIAFDKLDDFDNSINDEDLITYEQDFLIKKEDVWFDADKVINLYKIIFYELYLMMKSSKKYFVKNVKEYYGGILSFEAGIIGDVTEEDEKWMNLFNLVSSEINKHNNDE